MYVQIYNYLCMYYFNAQYIKITKYKKKNLPAMYLVMYSNVTGSSTVSLCD